MSKEIDPKKQWYAMLNHMLEEYREGNPDDSRTDLEIINDLMEYFAESGLVKKKDGKYVIPRLTDNA